MRLRPHQLTIRLSADEMQNIKNKVSESGLTQQQYITAVLNNKTIYNSNGLKELVPQIKYIGININQIAKKANNNIALNFDDISELQGGLNKIWVLLKQYTARHQ